ncbi:MAG TPA: sulfatase [Pirellulales bacterium]|nr:sulfatase [Pirellulales bacterium]
MKRLAALASTIVLLACGAASHAAEVKSPNFVFILTDDLGWRDLSCYGSTFYETPNLDRLASQGTRFTNAYAACQVCSPTRASMVTGKYPARLHLTDYIPGARRGKLNPAPYLHHLPLEEVTLAEALHESGYATAFFGKWHLGGPGFYPDQQGFELNVGGCEKGAPPSYFSPYRIPTLTDGPKGEYLTDRLTDEALKFLDSVGERPFLLYFSHYAVHNPQQAKRETIEKYRAKAARLSSSGPAFLPEGKRQARQIQNQPVYAAMIESLDQSVGRVLDKLAERGLDENTVVFFTSDNGGLSTSEGSPTSNVPLRAGKGWMYEGGVREPLIVKWPGVAKPGSICDAPVISTDFYPTMLEQAGLPARPKQHVDGVSLAPLLRGEKIAARSLFWHYPHYGNQGGSPSGAVRDGDYKLVEWFEDDHVELFNLAADLSEQRDLAEREPAKTAELRRQLHAWRGEVQAAMPTPNPDFKPKPDSK